MKLFETKIIAVSNQKGGVGKTTSAVNIAAYLAVTETPTLLIDMDPQANATSGVGIEVGSYKESIYDVIIGKAKLSDVVQKTDLEFLEIAPSSAQLVGAEIELVSLFSRERMLKEALEDVEGKYKYIIIDSPPSLGLLTINVLTSAHTIVIPIQCEYYALEGLSQLMRTIDMVRGGPNPNLEVEGVLLTMFDGRNNLARQVASDVRGHFHEKVYHAVIPRNVRLSEAPSFGKPIILYDIKSRGCQSYIDLAREVLEREANRRSTQFQAPLS
mgnify:CR=1 FL=1